MEYILVIWDGKPEHYINVYFQSLRRYNKSCIVYFYYKEDSVVKEYECFNIKFKKINDKKWHKRRLHHKGELTRDILQNINTGDKLLVLDCDLLFQNNPFLMFDENPGYDLYYTECVMSMWRVVDTPVNGGVRGFVANENSIRLLNFWLENNLNPTWGPWVKFDNRILHQKNGVDWWYDQDFLNCIHFHKPPFKLKKINVGFKYNYFTSKWGFFSKFLEMNTKIGNKNYVIIHFKADFKSLYNINNPKIYNMNNILKKNILYTDTSRITKIYNSRLKNGCYYAV